MFRCGCTVLCAAFLISCSKVDRVSLSHSIPKCCGMRTTVDRQEPVTSRDHGARGMVHLYEKEIDRKTRNRLFRLARAAAP